MELSEGTDTQALVHILVERYPRLKALLPRCALARNGNYVRGVEILQQRDEIALMPPVSGGSVPTYESPCPAYESL